VHRPLISAVPQAEAQRRKERERRLAALDAAIARGVADAAANDVEDAEAVFDAFEAKYGRMAAERDPA
jgi:antitoxin ParD1/3/4